MTNQSPQISIVIPAHNAEQTIGHCLDALAHQAVPRNTYEIIVVDDGSSDQTGACVKAHDGVRLFSQSNAGPAAARNLGVHHAHGEIVLFTDADCEPAQDWIQRMVAPFRNGEIVGVKGTYLTRQRELVARFVQLEYQDKYDRMAREPYIDFVDTYAAGYRRSVLVANDGFDPTFPVASAEDQELSFRLARQGHKMVFLPEARVYHRGHPRSPTAYWRKKFNIGYWKVLVHRKHPDKLLRDSHTPQILKAQIVLVGLAGLLVPAGLLWPPLWSATGLLGLLFLLTTFPFCAKAWPKDPVVAVISPGLLFVRALALGMGFAAGLVVNLGSRGRIREWRGLRSTARD